MKLYFNIQLTILMVLCCVQFCFANPQSSRLLEDANAAYQQYLSTKDSEFLEKAYLNYYKASRIEPSSSSYLGMGMVFIEKEMYSNAKSYLYRAYSIDEHDPTTNYYLGVYSFNNGEYLRALDFYKSAYDKGLSGNYDVNLKLGTIYEKLGDLEKAKVYYEAANAMNPTKEELEQIEENSELKTE